MFALALTKLWKPLLLVGVVMAIVAYRELLVHQRDAARAEASQLKGQVAALQVSNHALNDSIAQQNAAIETLREREQSAAAAAADRETEQANAAAAAMRTATARAQAMIHAAVPSGCEGAIRWGNAQGPELGRW